MSAAKKPPVGSGKRFSALEDKLAARKDVEDPGALAAKIGRDKYGAEKMAKIAQKGAARAAK